MCACCNQLQTRAVYSMAIEEKRNARKIGGWQQVQIERGVWTYEISDSYVQYTGYALTVVAD